MVYYTVPLTGTGDDSDPFRPSVPEGTSYAVIGPPVNGEVLIVTTKELPVQTGRKRQLPRQALGAQARARGISYEQVLSGWWVSDGTEPVPEPSEPM